MKSKHSRRHIIIFLLLIPAISCKKLVEIAEPINTITTSEAFATDANAESAIAGIYNSVSSSPYISTQVSELAGLSADELVNSDIYAQYLNEFQTNTITLVFSSNAVSSYLWNPFYSTIYRANAAIEALAASKSVTPALRDRLTAEARFVRAFCYFHLVNLFGDVPLVTSTDFESTRGLPRTATNTVYDQMIDDLTQAKETLPDDYSFVHDERTHANKWAAAALLARVLLYKGDWVNAEKESSAVIDVSSLYSLSEDLNSVFLKNNPEAIWQLEVPNKYPYATREAADFIPGDLTIPYYYLSADFLQSIEPGDQRRTDWLDSNLIDDGTNIVAYYFPYKYKVKVGAEGDITEYVMVLRLAEQYLIRAEAKANQDKLSEAIDDLNMIRHRAVLPDLPAGLSQTEILDAVARERRIEFFSEWGHRWLDLKRTEKADAVLSLLKPQWQAYQKLYPIPTTELQSDPALKQNPGY